MYYKNVVLRNFFFLFRTHYTMTYKRLIRLRSNGTYTFLLGNKM